MNLVRTDARTVIVGGISRVHDALAAAALRGRGVTAVPLAQPDHRALAAGRALLARGHCNPTYYLAGALALQLRAIAASSGEPAADVAARHAHLTAGSCGPCRFATYAGEHRRALAAAGFAGLPVVALDQNAPRAGMLDPLGLGLGLALDARLVRALADALLTADVLVRAGCAHRPGARDPALVDEALAYAGRACEAHLAAGRSPEPALAALGATLDELPRANTHAPAPVRVLLTGEFFARHTDGEASYDLVRWLEARGARVTPPAVGDWLLYLLWQRAEESAGRAPRPGVATPMAPSRTRRLAAALRTRYRRLATAAGLDGGSAELADHDDLATLAAPHYSPALRGGSGHLEIADLLAADRDGTADLVVSIKPFGCLPSSAVSDGVAHGIARRARRVAFVAIETTGDAEAQVASRLELALDAARSLALYSAPGRSTSSQSVTLAGARSETT